jgi:flagellar biosynthetic protein FliQ
MDMGLAVYVFRNSIVQIIIMAAPILLIGMTVGLVISVIQATTSIQEQTLTFVPKIVAILGTIIFLGPWIMGSMQQFAVKIITMIPDMVK